MVVMVQSYHWRLWLSTSDSQDMIKYLGSKRTLIPVLGELFAASGAKTGTDLFTGTTRVAQEMKRQGLESTACDIATYAGVFAETYIATDADAINVKELAEVIADLNSTPGIPGYVTEEFCEKARYFQPKNGARIDAIRERIESEHAGTWLYPILLTSLIEAADRVDSTVGIQMAYLKQWAARSYKDMEMRVPELLSGAGTAVVGDAMEIVDAVDTDLIYLDPPYNQHRYFTNYHVWETLVRWDRPVGYGIANKRIDARDDETKSVFNKKREMPLSMKSVIDRSKSEVMVVSFNNEGWISSAQMMEWIESTGREKAVVLDYDFKRYVGAQIGVYSPDGVKRGEAKHGRNIEHIFIAGPEKTVDAMVSAVQP